MGETTTPPDGDYLGYGDYADTLWARIERSLQKDADGKTKLGDDPLVVGIFGEWGAGKSKLLSMVQARAAQQSERDVAKRIAGATSGDPMTVTVPVYFQPWKYEHERHLHVPLAVHIADALKDTWKKLPADIEALKKWCLDKSNETDALAKNLNDKKETFDKVIGFFKGAASAVKSNAGAVVAGTADVVLVSVGVPPLASVARKKMIDAMETESQDSDDDEDGEASKPNDESPASPAKADKKSTSDAFKHTDDGLGFYRMHRYLHALTRPKLDKKLLEDAGINVTPGIEFDLRINFVVFIDDLDRCLPEKAVEALELIKTVFNNESFAFVLALDEEVVERGIGHRYRDYNFEGKKPEMPITGFEYLEKIVHLPFRLSALTEPQAVQFVRRYEGSIEKDANKRWFDAPWQPPLKDEKEAAKDAEKMHSVVGMGVGQPLRGDRQSGFGYDLLPLTLKGFDAYVPRKLIRMVELMHQTAAVAEKRSRPLSRHAATGGTTGAGAAPDTRVVLALVMIQLFQPELYRIMRRRVQAFPFLLATFADRGGNAPRDFPTAEMSDIDLWDWVAKPGTTANSARRARTAQAVEDAVKRIGEVYQADHTQRNYAQHTRLPVVTQLVEHRSAQRHVFDVLKLMHALATSLEASATEAGNFGATAPTQPSPAASIVFTDYISLLAQTVLPAPTITGSYTHTAQSVGSMRLDARPVHSGANVDKLFSDLLNPKTEVQANLAADLPPGHVLASSSVVALLQKINAALTQDADATRQHLISGLPYLAPYLSRQDGPRFWELVQNQLQGADALGIPLKDEAALAQRERWADLQSTLGADLRFDGETLYGAKIQDEKPIPGVLLYLPKARHGWTNPSLSTPEASAIEPIPGFVRIPGGTFKIGQAKESDNLPRDVTVEQPFYIARYLTTVDQYASFVDDGGYQHDGWWDIQGVEWREGRFDTKVKNENYREHLARRTVDLRKAPMDWDEQRSRGSRPVMCLNWFEARAYTRWLQERLGEAQPYQALFAAQGALAGYKVALPTEAQWERAARAQDLTRSDPKRVWPWEGDDKTAHLKANIAASKIGRGSVVGLFEPNPAGLHDMVGNLWEWQDNLYDGKGDTVQRRLAKDKELKSLEDLAKSDRPALRGGSWNFTAINARCSFRHRLAPVDWNYVVGFRVVLSLANLNSET